MAEAGVAPESRRARRRRRTEEALLTAAEQVFGTHGYAAATVEQIAAAADVAVGSVYSRFDSKEGLFLAVVDRALAENEAYMRAAYEAEGTPLERLLGAAAAYLRFFDERPAYFRWVALPQLGRRTSDEPPAAAQAIAERVDRLVAMLEDLVREARDAGELRECDPRLTARFCWAAWNGVVSTTMRPDALRFSDEEMRAVLAEGQRILLQGIVAGLSPPRA